MPRDRPIGLSRAGTGFQYLSQGFAESERPVVGTTFHKKAAGWGAANWELGSWRQGSRELGSTGLAGEPGLRAHLAEPIWQSPSGRARFATLGE
ncbi:MAG: hypothetical protein RIS70_6 [Planctomycetota bacterium]